MEFRFKKNNATPAGDNSGDGTEGSISLLNGPDDKYGRLMSWDAQICIFFFHGPFATNIWGKFKKQ